MDVIKTKRLLLRPFCKGDLVQIYEYAKDPLVGPDAGWKPHASLDETRAVLQEFMRLDEVWALVLPGENRVIGSIGLHPDKKRTRPKTRMLGYVLASPHWGKGYMTEAARAAIAYGFNDLGLDLVSIYHYPHNSRSRRVIEKCGFRYEARLRNASQLPDGRLVDEMCYSLARPEYTARLAAET